MGQFSLEEGRNSNRKYRGRLSQWIEINAVVGSHIWRNFAQARSWQNEVSQNCQRQ